MPYLSKEDTKAIRTALKAKFPKVKMSIRNGDHRSLYITIQKADIEAPTNGYVQVNHYRTHIIEQQKTRALVEGILEEVYSVKPRNIESVDGDYGNIPNYYINLSIGSWDKPFEQMAA